MEIKYLIPLYLGGTILFLIFLFFLFFYVIINNRRQRYNEQEKAKLIVDHQKNVLNARLEEQQRSMNQLSKELQEILGRKIDLTQTNLKELLSKHTDQTGAKLLGNSVNMLEEAGSAMRNISNSLSSDYMKARGLSELLSNELTHIGSSGRIACRLDINANYRSPEQNLEPYIYRIAQEAMTNATKHAAATELLISLNSQADRFVMSITDNGIGFDQAAREVEEGQGFRHMRQRAELLEGTVFVQAAPGKGCRVSLIIDNMRTSAKRLVL